MFYGWYVVAACTLITLYVGGVANFGFTAIFGPLATHFGWSYADISLAASLRAFELGLLSAPVGLLVDRLGPRKLLLGGSALVFLGYMMLSRISSLGMFYLSFVLIALGMSACTGTVVLTAVTHWFSKKAGIATGIVVSGFALGGLMVPVVTFLIGSFQWRTAMIIVGAGMLVLCAPLALIVRHRPEQYGYLPDGEISPPPSAPEHQSAVPRPVQEHRVPIRQVLKSRPFWHISISSMCHSFVVGAIVTHIMPYLGTVSIDRSLASLAALVLPVLSIAGRLGAGPLAGRLGGRPVYAASFVAMTAGLLAFSFVSASSLWLVVLFIACFSMGWGLSVTSRITLIREHYGRSSFGAVIGFNSTIMMIGNMSGAPIAGWAYDHWGTYHPAWLAFLAITLTGMVMAATVPSLRRGAEREPALNT